jgi:tRNA pseudouridine38-40 synthase
MSRYFIEVSYKGTGYAGFQIQKNANTVQAEIEKAIKTYFRTTINLTGSSRTDAGVHARQNFFHFDADLINNEILLKAIYHINAILPFDIVVKSIKLMPDTAHCRFDAVSRSYKYTIFQSKDPFLNDVGYYYPYNLNLEELQKAAVLLFNYTDFETFAKKNNQAHTNICTIQQSVWLQQEDCIIYNVTANRFLRGMVRGLVGTMLKVGRGIHTLKDFQKTIESKSSAKADFSTPPQGLTLLSVNF